MARPLGQRLAVTGSLGDYNPICETSCKQNLNAEQAAAAFDHGL
jgi:hypothetical protein